MSESSFNREDMARFYALRHLNTDPATQEVYYLPKNAPDREIRFVEVNDAIVASEGPIEPLDVGVDIGSPTEHCLLIVDVTPSQWDKINKSQLPLPGDWSLEGAVPYRRQSA